MSLTQKRDRYGRSFQVVSPQFPATRLAGNNIARPGFALQVLWVEGECQNSRGIEVKPMAGTKATIAAFGGRLGAEGLIEPSDQRYDAKLAKVLANGNDRPAPETDGPRCGRTWPNVMTAVKVRPRAENC